MVGLRAILSAAVKGGGASPLESYMADKASVLRDNYRQTTERKDGDCF